MILTSPAAAAVISASPPLPPDAARSRPHAAATATPLCAPGSPLEPALRLCEAAARRDCPVCLRGESGTGKEVLARYLHDRSPRARGPFVAVNCGALPSGLLESELFGHRKGAFTGATSDHPGRFRQADGGTLFLDEIGDLPLEAQVRRLRALQEKRVSPVGDLREYPVDFRLVCATHRDLAELTRQGRFREDLLFRLDVIAVRLPPLRERPDDISLLLRHFLAGLMDPGEAEKAWRDLPPALLRYPFPGNIRELRNLAERYCVFREMGGGWEAVLPPAAAGLEKVPTLDAPCMPATAPSVPEMLRGSRRSDREILHALGVCGQHRGRASGFLGITRRALQYRLAKMGRTIPG